MLRKNTPFAWTLVFMLSLVSSGLSQTNASTQIAAKPEASSKEALSSQSDASDEVESRKLEKRKKIIEEAVVALNETYKALDFISRSETDSAIESLEKAVGKLEIVLAREPALALAPVSVSAATQDVIANPQDVERLVEDAKELLGEKKVQKARRILQALASETVISTTNLPLETYPEALKLAAAKLDQGQLDEAASVLEKALTTQVVTDLIIPLPVVRARFALASAESLAEKDGRTEDENSVIESFLLYAEESIRLAEALGYGANENFEGLYADLEDVRRRTLAGNPGTEGFNSLKETLLEMSPQNQ